MSSVSCTPGMYFINNKNEQKDTSPFSLVLVHLHTHTQKPWFTRTREIFCTYACRKYFVIAIQVRECRTFIHVSVHGAKPTLNISTHTESMYLNTASCTGLPIYKSCILIMHTPSFTPTPLPIHPLNTRVAAAISGRIIPYYQAIPGI